MSNQWRLIASAPKDGTPVLIAWLDDDGQWQQRCAHWDREFNVEGYADDDAQTTIWQQAWTDGCIQSFAYEEVWTYEPTHWQPLPDPPSVDQGRD